MEEYEVKVLCAKDATDEVIEYMRSNGYKDVDRKDSEWSYHSGILESTDLDTAVKEARKVKRDLGEKVISVKMIPPQ